MKVWPAVSRIGAPSGPKSSVGAVTDFFLALRYPDGTARHDLGLYEALFRMLDCQLALNRQLGQGRRLRG